MGVFRALKLEKVIVEEYDSPPFDSGSEASDEETFVNETIDEIMASALPRQALPL